MDWKAITIGFTATLIIGLIIQLVYMLIAALIGAYSVSVPAIAPYKEILWLAGALSSFALTMLIGGAITMMAASTRKLINPLVACMLAGVVSVGITLGDGELTLKSIGIVLLGALFSVLGGHLVRRAEMPLDN